MKTQRCFSSSNAHWASSDATNSLKTQSGSICACAWGETSIVSVAFRPLPRNNSQTSLYKINAVAADLREARISPTLTRKKGIRYRSSSRSSHNRAVLTSSGTLCAFSDSRNRAESCGSNCVGSFCSTALLVARIKIGSRIGNHGKCVTSEG